MTAARSGRRIVYTNQTPFETDVLYSNMYNMVNAAYLAQAVLGGSGTSNATLVSGIPVTQNTVPNLSVLIGAGCMFNFQQFDATDYGVIPADTATSDKLYKLYIQTTQYNSASTVAVAGLPLTFTPPVSGTTNYLLQATFNTDDVDNANRPYYNPSDPDDPIYATEPETRQDTIFYSLKSAVSPAIPTPDAGYVGLYVIAVASGATTIVNGDISVYSGAPFITESLTQKISQATADARYAPIGAAIPPGAMLDFGGTSVPTGFLLCDGTAVSRATYVNLFGAIGTTWCPGDGSTTFNLPDFRRRTAVGSGGSGTGILSNTVGSVGGVESHMVGLNEIPDHTHAAQTTNDGAADIGAGPPHNNTAGNTSGINGYTGQTALSLMQPSAVVTKIIKT
jgi:microcystin-dependent protein